MFYVGWLMFFGIHAGMLVPALKRPLVSRLGESGYKGMYSLISVVGLVLLIYGYERGVFFDIQSPLWVRETSIIWMFFAWLFMVSANVAGLMRKVTRHPMTIGLSIWGLGHAVMNPHAHAWLIFLGFSLFAAASAFTAASRGKAPSHEGSISMDLLAVAIAAVATSLSFYFHEWIAGVPLI